MSTSNGEASGSSAGEAPKKTTAKLNQIEKQADSGRRLVEYFVVVTAVEKNSPVRANLPNNDKQSSADMSFSDWRTETSNWDEEDMFAAYQFRPTITARYPVVDHADNPLLENVTFFCHPSGTISLRTEPYMPKVHFFAATGGTGRQLYGTCLTLWEPYNLKMKRDPPTSTSEEDQNDTQEQSTVVEREVFLPKCLVVLSTYPYLAAFREYLTQLNRLSKLGEMTLPLERYIVNFCSEIPAPPPGSFEVQTTLLDSVIRIWSPPHNLPIAYVSIPFANLFECLDIGNIILVWHCLVLERQVLITSTQLSMLTTASEIFLALLFPMRWSHAYIPVLPHFLIPILSAPMPFLCGINKTNLADALYDLSRDCVLVDLDKNTVTLGPDTAPLPPLPPFQEASLRYQLEENVGMVFREARSLTKNDDFSEGGTHLPVHVKLMADAMWEGKLCLFDEAFHLYFTPEQTRKNLLNGNDSSGMDASERQQTTGWATPSIATPNAEFKNRKKQSQWDAVQEAFLDTFVYLLRNYRKYLVFPSKHNEGSYGGAGFRSKEFVENQRYDMRAFLSQLIGTQMFDNFITKRLYGSGEADVAFFDRAVDRFLKNAGMFADVDFTGRFSLRSATSLRSSGSSSSGAGSMGGGSNSGYAAAAAAAAAAKNKQVDQDPLLQSARVHRKLKTIVPPEPTGEGLPANINFGPSVQVVVSSATNGGGIHDDMSTAMISAVGTVSTSDDMSGDESSVQSTSTSGSNARKSVRLQRQTTPLVDPNQKRYRYPVFPSKLLPELFGSPRPLPAAVIAEFDRQRKDAAQFRRKTSNASQTPRSTKKDSDGVDKSTKNNAKVLDDVNHVPPSPEVATFTVFFMAFSATVGKELVNMASTLLEENARQEERLILSTYMPPTNNVEKAPEVLDESKKENVGDERSIKDDGDGRDEEDQDPKEKEGVAEMKKARPSMGDVFGDDDEHAADLNFAPSANVDEKPSQEAEGVSAYERKESNDTENAEDETDASKADSTVTATSAKPRFTNKLSDLQIEEAKATGRGQLGLAFEMLTMMKKRGLKADPEAYQCLIDACGRVGDTKRATDLLAKMHEDEIVADGTVYACLVSAFSAESAWKGGAKQEELPEWANSTAVEMDWNKLQKRSLLDTLIGHVVDLDDDDDDESEEGMSAYQKLRSRLRRKRRQQDVKASKKTSDEDKFFVTEAVERQIALGENLLEIVFPDISVDTEDETCPRCNFLLSDDDVVAGWKPGDSNDYTTSCPNCTQRFVPHFRVLSSAENFVGSRGPGTPLLCERLSPWVLQKEIRSVMSDLEGIDNLLSPKWREQEVKNSVLWWNLVLSCMRYRFPFSFLLQGSFEQNLIAPMPEDEM